MARHYSTDDEKFMNRAFQLALLGKGSVSPNPLVGCVVVYNGYVIGEGWHKKYGGPHAEVNAIASVADQSLLKESTLYVTLEPCSHFGKTPPCADLIVEHQLNKVIVANIDTNPLVSENGIKKLSSSGIEVVTGVLKEKGRYLNRRFFTYVEKKRPYIILKWAETADGYIARENFDSKWISNDLSRQQVHRWRAEEDAILVGTSTALFDDPFLNVRDWNGKNPLRIIIDRSLKLPRHLHVFDGSQATICYNLLENVEQENLILSRVNEKNFLGNIIDDLYHRKVQSLLVEGGSATLQQFVEAGLWDEIRVFKSGKKFGNGIPAPSFHGKLAHEETIVDDWLFYFLPPE